MLLELTGEDHPDLGKIVRSPLERAGFMEVGCTCDPTNGTNHLGIRYEYISADPVEFNALVELLHKIQEDLRKADLPVFQVSLIRNEYD